MTCRLLSKYFVTNRWKTTCKLVSYWFSDEKCTCPLVPKHQSWVSIGTLSIAIWWSHRQSTLAVAIALLLLLLFNFIDAIKYTRSTMVDDHGTAQWLHKFVNVCMCFGRFCFAFVILYNKKYSARVVGEKKIKWSSWGAKKKPCLQRIFLKSFILPPEIKWSNESCLL